MSAKPKSALSVETGAEARGDDVQATYSGSGVDEVELRLDLVAVDQDDEGVEVFVTQQCCERLDRAVVCCDGSDGRWVCLGCLRWVASQERDVEASCIE